MSSEDISYVSLDEGQFTRRGLLAVGAGVTLSMAGGVDRAYLNGQYRKIERQVAEEIKQDRMSHSLESRGREGASQTLVEFPVKSIDNIRAANDVADRRRLTGETTRRYEIIHDKHGAVNRILTDAGFLFTLGGAFAIASMRGIKGLRCNFRGTNLRSPESS